MSCQAMLNTPALAPAVTSVAHRRPSRRGARALTRANAGGAMEQLTLKPMKKIEGTVRLPGSKSLSNRILLLAALAEGTTKVENLLDSDDIRYMVDALKVLGLSFTEDRENNIL